MRIERTRLLTEGTDEQTDAVECATEDNRATQVRILEHINLLTEQKTNTLESERNADLDALTRQAEQAREYGERLIRNDYAKQARALAATLIKLQAIDAGIRRTNNILEAAGRTAVLDSNMIRCTMPTYVEWTERLVLEPIR